MSNNRIKELSEYLGAANQLASGNQRIDSNLRRAASTAIRKLVLREEELLARLENRQVEPWAMSLKEQLLPRFRVEMYATSGPWKQVNETVFLGSNAQCYEDLIDEAFAKLKSEKFPDTKQNQWAVERAVSIPELDDGQEIEIRASEQFEREKI